MGPVFGEPNRSGDFWKKNVFRRRIGFCHCAAVLQKQVPKLCTDLDLSLLYILIFGTYSEFARDNNFLALGVCFPQSCPSAGRRFAVPRSRVQTTDESFRYHKFFVDEIRCKLDSSENPRSFEKYPIPTLRVDLNPSKTKSIKSRFET